MRRFSLSGPAGPNDWFNRRTKRCRLRASSANSGAPSVKTLLSRVQGFQGPAKAGITSATLSGTGDLLAQGLGWYLSKERSTVEYDPLRTLRMFGFGLFWYGPCQFYWYNLLDWGFPVKNTVNFIAKVALNQLALAPVTLSAVFTWNLALTGKGDHICTKIQNDLVPTMLNGWKFWVPAASINFYCVPLQHQVLYMSCCGVLWTAYLSFASTTSIATQPAPAAQ